jgi:hypothetical protein
MGSIGKWALEPDFRGCPFINAAAEYPNAANPVREAINDHRRWYREFLRDLLAAEGHPDPVGTADILVVLADGLLISGHIDDPTKLSAITRDAVARVLDMRR